MLPTELAFTIGHVVEGRSFALASFVLVLWDYLLTLDKEVEHFWSGSWSISRILFLLVSPYHLLALAFINWNSRIGILPQR
jgi:nucleoside recognition membrane protein YjiH